MRHAKSSWKQDGLRDFERPLNNRGMRDAPFMGKVLWERGIRADLIISSPALRAITTAKVIAEKLNYDVHAIMTDGALYDGDSNSMQSIVRQIDDSRRTAVVMGHNPALTLLANAYSKDSIKNIPTCAVACFQFEVDTWKEATRDTGALTFFEKPKKYFR